MSVYDSVNRNVSSRVRKVVRDGADVTSGDRQIAVWTRMPLCSLLAENCFTS